MLCDFPRQWCCTKQVRWKNETPIQQLIVSVTTVPKIIIIGQLIFALCSNKQRHMLFLRHSVHELWPNIVNQKWVLWVVLFNTLIKGYKDRPFAAIVTKILEFKHKVCQSHGQESCIRQGVFKVVPFGGLISFTRQTLQATPVSVFSLSSLTLSYTKFIMLRIYAVALDRLRFRLNTYLVKI